MKIVQEPKFQPITITLENNEEADLFWQLVIHCSSKRQGKLKEFADAISNWFSNNSQLGGKP
jgi:hypothetical protein